MNTVAKTFERLIAVVRSNPESQHADILAADLAAQLATLPGRFACVGLAHAKNVSRFQGYPRTLFVLEPYGVTLTRRRRKGGGVPLFASLSDPSPAPAAPAVVRAVPAPAPELPVLKVAA